MLYLHKCKFCTLSDKTDLEVLWIPWQWILKSSSLSSGQFPQISDIFIGIVIYTVFVMSVIIKATQQYINNQTKNCNSLLWKVEIFDNDVAAFFYVYFKMIHCSFC